MNSLSDWLYRVSSRRIALISLAIFLAFTALVLPGQAREANDFSGDAGTPDLSFFYTPDDLYGMAEAYGEAGRVNYIRARFTFDLAWPLVYTLFLATAISWTLHRTAPTTSRVRQLNLIPVAGAIFDYLENISTSLVMFQYPSQTPVVDWLASVFTPLKWVLISLAFAVLIVSLAVFVRRKISAKGVQ